MAGQQMIFFRIPGAISMVPAVSQALQTDVSSESHSPVVTFANVLALKGAITMTWAHFLSSMCKIGAPRVQAGDHSEASLYIPSTFGKRAISAKVGCSVDCPSRNFDADAVKTRRIDRFLRDARALMMGTILMVATDLDDGQFTPLIHQHFSLP